MKKLPILLLLALCACAPKAKTYLWNEADATVDRAVYDEQYKLNQAEWDAVFAWLAKPETKTLPAGRYEITDQTYATVQIDSTRLTMNYEDHHKRIDLFYIVSGSELINVTKPENMVEPGPYSESRDAAYSRTATDFTPVVLNPGQYVILFPSDAHQPMLAPDGKPAPIHKIVAKIPFVQPE
ncbi:MAG: YhcH/YjgK/YiaL family protein [Bacteroidales bacterium]|nr:YhcH/YjgK/YiaL family protein [Bacteroidales bacterium]MBR3652547.1 YhcH/YjgK/YiaL family protein [Bacteroidales bacterium]